MYQKIVLILCLFLFTHLTASAQTYNIFVDITNDSTIEDGSEDRPFNTIEEAVALAISNDVANRNIYIANGEYLENIELLEGMGLFGESNDDTIINGATNSATVTMQNDTILENIKIYKGDKGISVEKNSQVKINKVKIQKTKKIGINIEESSKKRTITIKDCTISDNDGKGIYIKKRNYAKIYDNDIYDNDEEGIDIRSSAKGSIKNNHIYKNGESGIELIVERSKMKITKNKLNKNSASGIALQAYIGGLSSVSKNTIEKNKISSNKKYGLDCGAPSGLKTKRPVLWSQSVNPKNNEILKNKLGIFSSICQFKTY